LPTKVVFITDSKTPTGVADVPLTAIALEAIRSQIEAAGPGQWLFPSDGNKTGPQTEFKKIWRETLKLQLAKLNRKASESDFTEGFDTEESA
jgi:hypothetical protein